VSSHFLAVEITQVPHRGGVGSKTIGDDLPGLTVALQGLLQEAQSRRFIARFGDVALQDLAFVVYRAPEVVHLPIDPHIDLINVPLPMPEPAHPANPLPPDVGSKHRADLFHHSRTVSLSKSIPSSNSRSFTFSSDSGNQTYISTTSRITSGDEWKYRNGLAGLRGLGMPPPYSAIALNSKLVQFL